MRVSRTVTVQKPLDQVFAYLSDFTTTTEWDPGTVRTVRIDGDGAVGTKYHNTSSFAGRQTELTYVVQDLVANERIALRAESSTLIAQDTMTFRSTNGSNGSSGSSGPTGSDADYTEVTYTANFTFKGLTRFVVPFLRPAFTRLGDEAEAGMAAALTKL